MWDFKILKTINLFADLDEDELLKLNNIVEVIEVEPHRFVCLEGDTKSDMYCIMSGTVEVSKNIVADKRKPLVTLSAGQFFGEMSLFDNRPRSANVMTLEKTLLFRINHNTFEDFTQLYPNIGQKIYKRFVRELCQRIRVTADKVQERIFWGFVSKSQ